MVAKLLPNLYLGRAKDLSAFQKLGCNYFIDLREKQVFDRFGYHTLDGINIPFRDGIEPQQTQLADAVHTINKNLGLGKIVAVFCHRGQSRTAMAAMALLLDRGYPYHKAYHYLLSHYPAANIHPALALGLLKYQQNKAS